MRLATAEQEAEGAPQELIKADRRTVRQILTAPVDGVVQKLAAYTVGGVVNTGDPVLVVVPAGRTLEVEASVLNKDVGFVEAGQIVEVKLEAFPFTRCGTIHGYLDGCDAALWHAEAMRRDAVERRLLVIAEAAASLGELAETDIPDQPWPAIRGIGNRRRHEYGAVDDRLIWNLVSGPQLQPLCDAVAKRLDRGGVADGAEDA